MKNNNIAVFYGGDSSERDISLCTGRAVFEALISENVKAELFDLPNDLGKFLKDKDNFDLVFIALHGSFGEKGSIQGMLEVLGIPFTGSGVLGSSIAMDKLVTKAILRDSGLPVIDGISLPENINWQSAKKLIKKFVYPCVLKPVSEGSSIDVFMISSESDLDDLSKIQKIDNYFSDKNWMVERKITGREFAIGILPDNKNKNKNKNYKALPVVEIKPKSGFYDYKAKYISGDTNYECPADLSEIQTQKMQDIALKAFKALKCSGWGRIDILMDKAGMYILEANTIPGLTKTSLLPKAASKIGISFSELVLSILPGDYLKHDKLSLKKVF